MPTPSRYSIAASRPTASAMGGVPASNFHGTSLVVKPSRRTSRIISPPPRNGGIASSSSGRAEHLVPRQPEEVDSEGADVGREMRRLLSAVHQDQGAGGVGGASQLGD